MQDSIWESCLEFAQIEAASLRQQNDQSSSRFSGHPGQALPESRAMLAEEYISILSNSLRCGPHVHNCSARALKVSQQLLPLRVHLTDKKYP